VFSTEFKRTTVQQILTGEKTLAELSRELDISPSVIRNWKRFAEAGAPTAVQASEDVVPASQLREAYAKIRELERALGRKTMEVEILRAAQEGVNQVHAGGRADRSRSSHGTDPWKYRSAIPASGIAPEDQEKVFEEFRQVGTAEKRAEGIGLGLTLCRKFIHGGRIWVMSQVGVGSTFTFTIPVGRGQ
jgi:transposase-like protein